MDGYKSLLDFVEIEEETTCKNCKRKCARKSDMAKHECGCGCGAITMSCMECPIGVIFRRPVCKKMRNEIFLSKVKKKQIKKQQRNILL